MVLHRSQLAQDSTGLLFPPLHVGVASRLGYLVLQPPAAQDPLLARFLLFAPEYRPEVVDALVPVGSTVAQALEILQLV